MKLRRGQPLKCVKWTVEVFQGFQANLSLEQINDLSWVSLVVVDEGFQGLAPVGLGI